MPHTVKRKGRVYQIVSSETGDVRATARSQVQAAKKLALLNAVERDWEPTGDGRYKRTIDGRVAYLTVTGGK